MTVRSLRLGAIVLALTSAAPAYGAAVGRQPDGSVILPSGQRITPAGQQLELPGASPTAVAVRPGGGVAALNGPLRTITTEGAPRVLSELPGGGVTSATGIAWTRDGRTLLASDGGAGNLVVVRVDTAGRLGEPQRIGLPKDPEGRSAYPAGIALSADERTAYVVLRTQNALGVVDLAKGRLERRIAVGNAPMSVTVRDGLAWVTNEGGRPARPGEFTNASGGTPIVADPFGGGAATGTVSAVDPVAGREIATVPVGLHPTAILAWRGRLWIANTYSDTVSVVDPERRRVVSEIGVRGYDDAPLGAMPTGLAALSNRTLAVSLGRANAVALIDTRRTDRPRRLGLLPTGWYPSAVAGDDRGRTLVVPNLQGLGSVADADAGRRARGVGGEVGSVGVVELPHRRAIDRSTARVAQNNGWGEPPPGAARGADVVPQRIGERSRGIRHVVYIVKENRTYDQVLGDIGKGNSDPSLVNFGERITPNHHALAREFPLLDNCFVSGRASNDGHQWALQATNPDYLQRNRGPRPAMSPPSSGFDALLYTPSGFLWENALRHGRTIEDFGEFTIENRPPPATTDIPSLKPFVVPEYVGYNTAYPDQQRADAFLARLARHEAEGSFPDLTLMLLPNDHTASITPATPDPESYMVDNDLALGRIVSALTLSRFWRETAIFVVEDDAQGGADHVDGHRTLCYVISPYARRGAIDSTLYTQVNIVRTIEQLLGLPPMNANDAAAAPMRSAFTDEADTAPYIVRPNAIPVRENPPISQLDGLEKEWALAMSRQDFKRLDRVDERLQKRSLWYHATRWRRPFPGDRRMLTPAEAIDAEPDDDDDDTDRE